MPRTLTFGVMVLLALVVMAPDSAAGANPIKGVYVGPVQGSPAFVAVAIGRGKARAYVCDSRATAVWFLGPIRNGEVDLHAGNAGLHARIDVTSARGTVVLPDGSVHAFNARLAATGGNAGLYRGAKRVDGGRYVAGWVVLPSRAQRGGVLLFAPSRSTTIAVHAPPLDPEAASVVVPGAGSIGVVKLGESFIDINANP